MHPLKKYTYCIVLGYPSSTRTQDLPLFMILVDTSQTQKVKSKSVWLVSTKIITATSCSQIFTSRIGMLRHNLMSLQTNTRCSLQISILNNCNDLRIALVQLPSSVLFKRCNFNNCKQVKQVNTLGPLCLCQCLKCMFNNCKHVRMALQGILVPFVSQVGEVSPNCQNFSRQILDTGKS